MKFQQNQVAFKEQIALLEQIKAKQVNFNYIEFLFKKRVKFKLNI